MWKILLKYLILANVGGIAYVFMELFYRGYSHWAMYIVAALSFIAIGLINEYINWSMELWKQMLIGAFIITTAEFLSGIILNLKLGWNIWDYSGLPLNIMGQVCLPFSIIWFFIAFIAIVIDDYLRYWLFNEEKPHYRW